MTVVSSEDNNVVEITKTAPEAMKHAIKATEGGNGIKGEIKYQMPAIEKKQPNKKLVFIRFFSVAIIAMGVGAGGGILVYRQLGEDPTSEASSVTENLVGPLDMEATEGTTTVRTVGGTEDPFGPFEDGEFVDFFPPLPPMNGREEGEFPFLSTELGLGPLETPTGVEDARKVDFSQLTCDFDGIPCDWNKRLHWSVGKKTLGSDSDRGINQTGNYLFNQQNLPFLATFESHVVKEADKYGSFCLSFTFYKSNSTGILTVHLLDYETQDVVQIWMEDRPSKSWRRAHVNISTTREFMILIEAENVMDNHVIAIDDIVMTNTTCGVIQDPTTGNQQLTTDFLKEVFPGFSDKRGIPEISPTETGDIRFPEFLDRRGRPESTLFE